METDLFETESQTKEFDNLVSLRLITHNLRLVEARKQHGYKQRELAKELGWSTSRLSSIENLHRLPTEDERKELAAALVVDVDYLFPEILIQAIENGVFDNRYKELEEVEIYSLSQAQQLGLDFYDGEDQMFEDISHKILREQIYELLDRLSEYGGLRFQQLAKEVIIRRFGLEDGHSMTLEEVGTRTGLTRERIRQIENKALRIMRHPKHSRMLKEYLE